MELPDVLNDLETQGIYPGDRDIRDLGAAVMFHLRAQREERRFKERERILYENLRRSKTGKKPRLKMLLGGPGERGASSPYFDVREF